MTRTIAIAAIMLMSASAFAADDIEHEEAASNHGYATAAYEVYCGAGTLTVSNPRLRAKFDKLYRARNSKWRSSFMMTYEAVLSAPAFKKGTLKASTKLRTCDVASSGDDTWLRFNPAARDLLEAQAAMEE